METKDKTTPVASDKIFTIPNVISLIRLCMVPAYLVLLFKGNDFAAAIVFAIAAATDFLDGQIARRTNTVTKLGQLLDPVVDRALMISVVIAIALLGRCPLWIIILVLLRDLLLLIGGSIIYKKYAIRVPVIYLGKVTTTIFFVGFALMILNWPVLDGLGLCMISWLPGFSTAPYLGSIWLIYIALILGTITTIYYVRAAYIEYKRTKNNGVTC